MDQNFMNAQLQQLEQAIKKEWTSKRCPAEQLRRSLAHCQHIAKKMSDHLKQAPCSSEQLRLYWKGILPALESYKLFVYELYRLRLNEPVGTLEMKQEFWRYELQWIQHYFARQALDYHYYKSGNTQLDDYYFPIQCLEERSPLFSHSNEHGEEAYSKVNLFAQFMAMEKLQNYLIARLEPEEPTSNTEAITVPEQKITKVDLSVDQLGLLTRAADDARIVIGRSFTSICEDLAPHLSTPQRTQISAHSLRSNAYLAEENDKLKVIKALRKMIDFIQGY